MSRPTFRALAAFAALAAACTLAQAQQEQARVISSTPIVGADGQTQGYSVTYEYAGRSYVTRTDAPPGPTLPIQVSPYGVATSPVAPHPPLEPAPLAGGEPWQNVAPEAGFVVGAPAPAVPPVIYAAPPTYVHPAYAWPGPYVYPPVGISLNLGYSRGWGRGWHGGGHGHGHWHGRRGWR